MKTTRLIIGIISMVLFIIIAMQSCAAGIGNALSSNGEISGSAGLFLAFIMLIAGIIGVVAKKSKAGSIAAGCFYVLASLIGFANAGSYSDLKIWSAISLIFGIVFIVSGIVQKKAVQIEKTSSEN